MAALPSSSCWLLWGLGPLTLILLSHPRAVVTPPYANNDAGGATVFPYAAAHHTRSAKGGPGPAGPRSPPPRAPGGTTGDGARPAGGRGQAMELNASDTLIINTLSFFRSVVVVGRRNLGHARPPQHAAWSGRGGEGGGGVAFRLHTLLFDALLLRRCSI